MADQILRSKITFGTSDRVESAKQEGKINEFDVLCLADADGDKMGWIDRDGGTHIVEPGMSETEVTSKIEEAVTEVNTYIDETVGSKVDAAVEEKVSESIGTKVDEAVESANAYTDQKVAEISSGYEIVEF